MARTAKKTKRGRLRRQQGDPRENPISLAPLDFDKALAGLLAVKPKPKDKKKPRQDEKKPGD